MQRKCQHCIP